MQENERTYGAGGATGLKVRGVIIACYIHSLQSTCLSCLVQLSGPTHKQSSRRHDTADKQSNPMPNDPCVSNKDSLQEDVSARTARGSLCSGSIILILTDASPETDSGRFQVRPYTNACCRMC